MKPFNAYALLFGVKIVSVEILLLMFSVAMVLIAYVKGCHSGVCPEALRTLYVGGHIFAVISAWSIPVFVLAVVVMDFFGPFRHRLNWERFSTGAKDLSPNEIWRPLHFWRMTEGWRNRSSASDQVS